MELSIENQEQLRTMLKDAFKIKHVDYNKLMHSENYVILIWVKSLKIKLLVSSCILSRIRIQFKK